MLGGVKTFMDNFFKQLALELNVPIIQIESGEFAWKIKDANDVIDYIEKKHCVILGGDILNPKKEYTYDNWFYNCASDLSLEENSKISVIKAIEYLSNYRLKNENDHYVVFVLEQNLS